LLMGGSTTRVPTIAPSLDPTSSSYYSYSCSSLPPSLPPYLDALVKLKLDHSVTLIHRLVITLLGHRGTHLGQG